jgi:hypothetical protein
MAEDPTVTRRYAYITESDCKAHKGKRSAYLVEQLSGSNVVARISSLGLVRDITAEQEVSLALMKRGITVVGKWAKTDRGYHHKSRLVIGNDFDEVK